MRYFRRQLNRMHSSNMNTVLIVLVGIAIILSGFFYKNATVSEFDPVSGSGNTLTVNWMFGPFADSYYEDREDAFAGFYIAEGTDEYLYMVCLQNTNEFTQENEFEFTGTVTLTGIPVKDEEIIEFAAETMGYSVEETEQYLGSYYLDTTNRNNDYILIVIAGIAVTLFGLYFSKKNLRYISATNAFIKKLKKKRILYTVIASYKRNSYTYNYLYCSDDYIIDTSNLVDGYRLIRLADYNKVEYTKEEYHCRVELVKDEKRCFVYDEMEETGEYLKFVERLRKRLEY